jgi:hypothetical protein
MAVNGGRTTLTFHEVDNLHVPYHLAPDGTKFIRSRFSDKIGKYGLNSPDAANPDVTHRVLTIMLASEY